MADERFTQGQETAPLRLGQKIGTREVSRAIGSSNAELASSTSKLRREAVMAETPDFIDGLLHLREALADATRTDMTLETGYRENTPPMTLIADGDVSGSMNEAMDLKSWARGDLKGNKVIVGEDIFYSIFQNALEQLQTGVHGKVDNSFGVFGAPREGTIKGKKQGENDVHVVLSETFSDPNRPDLISGAVIPSPNETVSKVMKPRGYEWNEEDSIGLFGIVREEGMRGNGTFLASMLKLRQEELARDPELAKEIKEHKRALPYFIVTDGLIHDGTTSQGPVASANQIAKELSEAGVFIIPVVIGGNSEGRINMEALAPGNVIVINRASDLAEGLEKLAKRIKENGRQGGSRRLN